MSLHTQLVKLERWCSAYAGQPDWYRCLGSGLCACPPPAPAPGGGGRVGGGGWGASDVPATDLGFWSNSFFSAHQKELILVPHPHPSLV